MRKIFSILNSYVDLIRGLSWPSRQEAWRFGVTVIVFSTIIAIYVGGLEALIRLGINKLI
jgi:preprotein translocase SecE subunit